MSQKTVNYIQFKHSVLGNKIAEYQCDYCKYIYEADIKNLDLYCPCCRGQIKNIIPNTIKED